MKKVLYFALIFLTSNLTHAQVYCDSVLDLEPLMDDTICFNGPFTLDATPNNYNSYLWQDGDTNGTYYVTSPGTYICEVVANTGNIVENGDFEDGTTNVNSDYTDMTGTGQGTSSNPNIGLWQEGTYAIGNNPHDYHANWNPMSPHTGNNMMIVNGDTSTSTSPHIWCQTIDVGANSDYVFSAWLTSIFNLNPATFIFTINGVVIGDTLQHSGNVGEWDEFFVQWHSDTNQTIDICINNVNKIANGNDFAIDDIFFGAACIQTDTIYVVENPTANFETNDVCSVDTVNFINTSTSTNGSITNYNWNFGDGWTSSQTTPSHYYNEQTTYNVTLTVKSNYGCTDDTTISVNINPPPSSTITTTDALCYNSNNGTIAISGVGGQAPYTYHWSFGSTDSIITNLPVGQYNVTITDANGCTNTNSGVINQPTQLITAANPTNVTCFGENNGEIDLNITGGTPPYSYTWNNGAHSEDIDSLNPNVYYVTVTDNNGCTTEETGSITGPLEINIVPSTSPILCHGDQTGSINIEISGGVAPYQYNWNNQATTEDLTNLYAGNYILTVTDNSGCTKIQTVNIPEPNPLVVSLPPDYIHCNQPTEIHASTEGGTTPYSYLWDNGNTFQDNDYQTDSTATYYVTATDAHGCVSTDQITITIIDVDIQAFANRDTVCPGDPILLTTNVIGGMAPYTVYSNGNISTLPVIVYPQGTQTYNIGVVDACGNTDSTIIEVHTYPIQPLSFNADILQGCPPLTVTFTQGNYSNNSSYTWNFDDIDENNYSDAINPVHTFTDGGIYDVSVNVIDSNGCENQLTINDMIEVYPKPEAHFEPTPEVVSFINSLVDFDNYSIDNFKNYWYFDDGNQSNKINPAHHYSESGIYYPMLVVESEKGCLDTAIHKVEVQNEFIIYVPTAFTPDGDAINDGFRAVGHGIDLDNYFIAVYDRWGEQIWKSEDLFEYWDGRAKDGDKIVQNGVYKWLIVCKDFNGVEHTKSGNVSVIR